MILHNAHAVRIYVYGCVYARRYISAYIVSSANNKQQQRMPTNEKSTTRNREHSTTIFILTKEIIELISLKIYVRATVSGCKLNFIISK